MSERTNRREQILNTAAELFRKQGYATTSVRQIAEVVGVTEAALYYHFKEGKRELLKEVFECEMPDLVSLVGNCKAATTLPEFIRCFGQDMASQMPTRLDRFRWILSEFATMDVEERALFHNKQMIFHNELAEAVGQFVDDDEKADHIAWLIATTMFGYGQMFVSMEMRQVADFSPGQMINLLCEVISAYIKP